MTVKDTFDVTDIIIDYNHYSQMLKSSLLIAAASMLDVNARISFGSCPEVKQMANFDKYQYVGKWFEIVRDYQNPFTYFTTCVTMEFSSVKDDGSFDQNYRGYYWPVFWYGNNDGVYYQCGEDSTLTWTCQATMGGGTIRGDIKIFDTDYTNYKILYDCNDIMGGLMKYETFNVFSREPTMPKEAYNLAKAQVKEKLPQYDLDWWGWTLEWTWQNGLCDYESGWKFDS